MRKFLQIFVMTVGMMYFMLLFGIATNMLLKMILGISMPLIYTPANIGSGLIIMTYALSLMALAISVFAYKAIMKW